MRGFFGAEEVGFFARPPRNLGGHDSREKVWRWGGWRGSRAADALPTGCRRAADALPTRCRGPQARPRGREGAHGRRL